MEIPEDMLVILLLHSLPEKFENFICAIEAWNELPTLNILRAKIEEKFEARRSRNCDMDTSNAMYV